MPRTWPVPSRRIAIGRSVSRSSTADPAGPASVIFARLSITSNPTGSAKTNSRVARGPCEVGSRQGAPVLVEHACRQAGRPTLNGQLYDLRRERNRRGSRSVRRRRRGGVRRTFTTRNHDEHGQGAELRSPSEPSGGRSRQRGQKYGRAQPSSGPNPGRSHCCASSGSGSPDSPGLRGLRPSAQATTSGEIANPTTRYWVMKSRDR